MNITGTIYQIGETKQVSETFQKREFVLETADNPQYPQYIPFQLTQEKVHAFEFYHIGEGDQVEVSFNLRGRKWTPPDGATKFILSLDAWNLKKIRKENSEGASEPTTTTPPPEQQPVQQTEADDLPF